MPLWRCPHCATPQPEAARCWVCRRSTTSCASCRHFRHGVASGLGFCGLDRNRLALRGDEIRGCWAARADVPPAGEVPAAGATGPGVGARRAPGDRQSRTFVPIEDLEARAGPPAIPGLVPQPSTAAMPAGTLAPSAIEGPRWSLWGDAES